MNLYSILVAIAGAVLALQQAIQLCGHCPKVALNDVTNGGFASRKGLRIN